MYGLSPDEDLSFLIGSTLCQVAFGGHDLMLSFDRPLAQILIMSCISYHTEGVVLERVEDFRQIATPLAHLATQEIIGYQILPGGTLELSFSNKVILHIHDDSPQYESYTIKFLDRWIVV